MRMSILHVDRENQSLVMGTGFQGGRRYDTHQIVNLNISLDLLLFYFYLIINDYERAP